MDQFVKEFIVPIAQKRKWKTFCEIGASRGGSTDCLLTLPQISHTIVDPGLDADLVAKYACDRRVTVFQDLSLGALPRMEGPYDCFLIDGDHNWFTVFNELELIRERHLLLPGGMVFFHDVDWPYGRRDMYYQPDTIPASHRLPFERKGILRGRSALVDSGGTNWQFCNAVREGGPRNGVLTAIEDFLAQHPSEYRFFHIRSMEGLGILQSRSNPSEGDQAFLPVWIRAGWQSLCALPNFALRHAAWRLFPGFMQKWDP